MVIANSVEPTKFSQIAAYPSPKLEEIDQHLQSDPVSNVVHFAVRRDERRHRPLRLALDLFGLRWRKLRFIPFWVLMV